MDHVQQNLEANYASLSQVSQRLLTVQGNMQQAEKSVLGKVFDLQTVRSFLTHHQQYGAANQVLRNDVAALNIKAEDLSAQVAAARTQLQAAQGIRRAETAEAQTMLAQEDGTILTLHEEIAKTRVRMSTQEKVEVKLTHVHDDLVKNEQLAAAKRAHDAIVNQQVAVATNSELLKHQSLRNQLISMHRYGEACHGQAESLKKALKHEVVVAPADTTLLRAVEAHAVEADNAAMQRLQAEKLILLAELAQAEQESKTAHAKLVAETHAFDTQKAQVVNEFKATRAEMVSTMDRIKTLGKAIRVNIRARNQAQVKRDLVEATRQEMLKELDPTKIHMLEAENAALKARYNFSAAVLMKSKMAEAKAIAVKDQATANMKASKKASAASYEEAEEAKKEGKAEVKEAMLKAEEEKVKARKEIDAAKAALEMQCRAKWDVRAAEKDKEVQQCDALASSLATEQAKLETLKTTLQAQVSADVAS